MKHVNYWRRIVSQSGFVNKWLMQDVVLSVKIFSIVLMKSLVFAMGHRIRVGCLCLLRDGVIDVVRYIVQHQTKIKLYVSLIAIKESIYGCKMLLLHFMFFLIVNLSCSEWPGYYKDVPW